MKAHPPVKNRYNKSQPQTKRPVDKPLRQAPGKTPAAKPPVQAPFIPVHYPKWIIVAILAFCFALYGNTMFNQFALDDTMVLTQNEFVKQGVAGIPKIFKYDTFIGRYGEKVTNLPGGRYRPLSVALLAAEFDIFVNPEVKQIVRNRLDSSTMQYAVPRKYIVQDMLPRIVDSTQSDVVIVAKPTPKQNEDDAPLYMKTALPYASHGVNILLYALVACFLFKLLWRLFPARDAHGWKWLFNVPVIATLLFVAHPVHVEAVANIKGRDEIMTFLGALMAMFYTLRWLDTRKTSFLIITFLCFLAGAFSKENALTFLALIPVTIYLAGNYKLKTILLFMALIAIPVFLLLKGQALAFLFVIAFFVILIAASPSSQMRTVAMALLPSFAAGLVFTCVRWSVISMDSLPETELMNNPFLGMRDVEKWASIIYGLGRYLWLLIFPHPLTTDYYPYHIPKVVINNAGINEFINTISIANPAVWMPLLIYGAMFAFIIWGLSPKRKNIYAYAILWYLVPLSIVCNVFVMIGTYMNERFVYISSVGFCLAIACFAVVHLPKWLKNERTYRLIVTTVLAAVLGLYSFQSISRNRAWFDDFTLSTTDARQSPRSAKANYDAARVYNIEFQRATTDSARAAITRQIYYYSKRAIEIHPVYENALLLYSWSNTSLGTMHPDSAAAYPQEASVKALLKLLERNPASPFAFDPLIMLSQRIPDPAQRIPFWEAVLQRAPERYEVHYQLASIYGKELSRNPATGSFNLEQMKKAIPYFENAIRYKPDFVNAFIDLGAMYGNTGEPVKAVDAFRKALDISPSDTLAWANLWRTYSALGDAAKASDAFQKYQSLRVRK